MNKTATLTFGRFQPATIGHKQLIDKIVNLAGGGDYYIFTSQTQDDESNPLEYSEKIGFMRALFPYAASHIVQNEKIKTISEVLEYLQKKGYTDIVYVCGEDRKEQFNKILHGYGVSEKEKARGRVPFNSIQIVSSGQRDPDAEGISGVSATKAREYAKTGNWELFKTMISDEKVAKDIYNALQVVMGKDPINGDDAYKSNKQSMKESFRKIIMSMLKEEEFAEKDRSKIIALRKKVAADKVKEKSEIEKSVAGQLKLKQDAFKMALKDTSPEADSKIEKSRDDVDKSKESLDSAKKITTAAKTELSSIKENILKEGVSDRITLEPKSKSEVEELISKHYLSKYPSAVFKNYGIMYLKDDGSKEMVGAILYGQSTKPNENLDIAIDDEGNPLIQSNEMLELLRLYLTPETKQNPELKNLASFVIAKGNKQVKMDKPDLKIIITRADSGVGHTGAIYQATNAIYLGLSDDRVRLADKQTGDFIYRTDRLKKYGFDTMRDAVKDAMHNQDSPLKLKKMSGKHFYMYIVDDKSKKAILSGLKKTIHPYPKKQEIK